MCFCVLLSSFGPPLPNAPLRNATQEGRYPFLDEGVVEHLKIMRQKDVTEGEGWGGGSVSELDAHYLDVSL